MSDKINSHICLMLSVYKSFHQTVKYGWQRNHILQDLTGPEILIYMKASKTKNRCETGLQKSGINVHQLALAVADNNCSGESLRNY